VQIQFERRARRDVANLSRVDAGAVLAAIESFATTGTGDVKKLRGQKPPMWRLRVGRWRVLYHVEGTTIVVDRVGDRRDVYR
jgi:mRNA interferase RelE/StbE